MKYFHSDRGENEFTHIDFSFSIDLGHEHRLMEERQKQNVTTPLTYSFVFDHNDNQTSAAGSDDGDNEERISSFKSLKTLVDDWWKSSNSSEHHLKPIRRKVFNMLSKCIWSMKVIRAIFRLLGDNLMYIDQKQGDRSTSKSARIDATFQKAIQTSIKNFLSTECQQIQQCKWIMWSNNNDILVGYQWYLRKVLVVETLLTLKPLPDILAQRTGKKIEK